MADADRTRDELLAEVASLRAELSTLRGEPSPTEIARLFAGILEAAPDGMLISDPSGTIHLANPEAERLLGYEPGELVGRSIDTLLPESLRERHVRHRSGYVDQPVTRRMGMGLELVALRKDDTELPTEISLRPLETPVGKFVVSAIRDVTERREAEALLRHQTAALGRSNEALQQFAYVASHDLQEPLRMVSSYLQLLERRYSAQLDSDAREFIGFAVDGAKRMQGLIQDLLAYARVGRSDAVHVRVDLNEVVRQVLEDLSVAVREAGAVVRVDRLPTVDGEPAQLAQLYQNLIGNGLKFRKPGVAPTIEIGGRRAAAGWSLWVRDDGIGLEPQYADRIFQIFQRLHTRSEYPGTGIGLAICKRIVEHHGGTIEVASSPGSGATFTFTVPDRRQPWVS